MYRIIEGDRPGRPASGFSDGLWGLLVSTWCAEHGSQPSKRPSTSAVLRLLNADVHNWGKTIIPPAPVQRGTCPTKLGVREAYLWFWAVENTDEVSGQLEGKFFHDRTCHLGIDVVSTDSGGI